LKATLRLAVAAGLVVSTWFAIERIAELKADGVAGGETFALDGRHRKEMAAFGELLDALRGWGETGLASDLAGLQESGQLWIAPHLAGRSAIYVRALSLVSRIYVRRDELLRTRMPFPELELPDAARRAFSELSLAGTLFHELQHAHGLEDEGATYDREIAWYRALGASQLPRLAGEEKRWFEWAVASAVESARAARAKAVGGGAGASEG
jgi:hypothetical protein